MSTGTTQATSMDSPASELKEMVPEVGIVAPEVDAAMNEEFSKDPDKTDSQREDVKLSAQDDGEVEFVKKPGEFTTEVFKIEIRNLPRYSGYKVSIGMQIHISVMKCDV